MHSLLGVSLRFSQSFRSLVLACLTTGILHSSSYSECKSAPVLGSFGAPRAGTVDLFNTSPFVVAKSYYGSQFPDIEYTTTQTLTPAYLAGIDVAIFSTTADDMSLPTGLSAAEQSALFNFVLGGGSVLIIGEGGYDDDVVEQSFFSPFGVHSTGRLYGNVDAKALTPNTHPITNGPYGRFGFQSIFGPAKAINTGWFDDLGPYAHPLITLSSGFPVVSVIERGELGPGSGTVVMTSDLQVIFYSTPFIRNVAEFLVPEPATSVMAMTGLALVGLGAWRKRRAGSTANV